MADFKAALADAFEASPLAKPIGAVIGEHGIVQKGIDTFHDVRRKVTRKVKDYTTSKRPVSRSPKGRR
jgi:hypothetical protein